MLAANEAAQWKALRAIFFIGAKAPTYKATGRQVCDECFENSKIHSHE